MPGIDSTTVVPTPHAIQGLVNTFTLVELALVLVPAVVLGALSGWSAWLVQNKEVRSESSWFGALLVGALAALVMLRVKFPPDLFWLLAQSIIAGFVGKMLLEGFGTRLLAMLFGKKLDEIKEEAEAAERDLAMLKPQVSVQSEPDVQKLTERLATIERIATR